jgi:hypothetical protein
MVCPPADLSIHSLQSLGAMAVLCVNVDMDHIFLLGNRWTFDEMLQYLHVKVFPVVTSPVQAMLLHGSFQLIPNKPLPNLHLQADIGGHAEELWLSIKDCRTTCWKERQPNHLITCNLPFSQKVHVQPPLQCH